MFKLVFLWSSIHEAYHGQIAKYFVHFKELKPLQCNSSNGLPVYILKRIILFQNCFLSNMKYRFCIKKIFHMCTHVSVVSSIAQSLILGWFQSVKHSWYLSINPFIFLCVWCSHPKDTAPYRAACLLFLCFVFVAYIALVYPLLW